MARIVVIGASTGGLPAAYELREALWKGHEVTVVSNTETFHFIPSNPWVAVGWRKREDISFPLRPYLKKKGIKLVAEPAARIDPVANEVHTIAGRLRFSMTHISNEPPYTVTKAGPLISGGASDKKIQIA